MHLWGEALTFGSAFFLLLALALAFSFEFVNGFHDTANAVATVIYTHSLRPHVAVVWSGLCNLTGVLLSSGLVAYGIIALLPLDLVLNPGSSAGFAMVFALLLSALIWNLGTWYLGLPASSSHAMIGSIMGVGVAYSMINSPDHSLLAGINWAQAQKVGITLLVSPLVGFICSAILLLVLKVVLSSRPELFKAPEKGKTPPLWIRGLLVLTCTGVSFSHGSNDGQKGMGLFMLILIGIVPGAFALRMNADPASIAKLASQTPPVAAIFQSAAGDATVADQAEAEAVLKKYKSSGKADGKVYAALASETTFIGSKVADAQGYASLPSADRATLRRGYFLVAEGIGKLTKSNAVADADQAKTLSGYKKALEADTKYIPTWVKIVVSIALGFGTMIGWKRIVVTVGEKIGKEHLTYAQGASAEAVAWATIQAADNFGLPVSTTHVLSSGIAGTMAANKSGLQGNTLRNLILAWVLTLPVTVLMGATLFSGSLYLLLHVFGVR